MPRGIPKVKSAIARIDAAIEELKPLHEKILSESKRLGLDADALQRARAVVADRLNQSTNALYNLGAMKRSLEQNKE